MINADFTIKNYRCFSDAEPLRFTLRNGFTAFVGPNNSGKSFILKFFYEFRNIWTIFSNEPQFNHLLRGGGVDFDILGIIDTEEIFNRFNDRELSVEIKIDDLTLKFLVLGRIQHKIHIKIYDLTATIKDTLIPKDKIAITFERKKFNYSDPAAKSHDAAPLIHLLDTLSKTIYIPSFRNAINAGSNNSYFDISVGSGFIQLWNKWKVGQSTWQSQRIQNITSNIKELFEYDSLEINASLELGTLSVVINGKVYNLHELGSGISQFILVFATTAIKEPSLILIDEPELNLHPAMQQKFITSLASYSKEGILFATHSIGLARSVADYIYSVTKPDKHSIVRQFDKTPNYAEFLGELNFSAYQDIGVEKILLVEGVTDVRTFQQLLRKKKKDKDFVILPLGGSAMINGKREQELADIKRITPKIYCWIDSEKGPAQSSLPNDRQEFLNSCQKLNIRARASDRRAIENYFTDEAVKKVKGTTCKSLTPFQILNPSVDWDKNENWLIAQAMEFDNIKNTDLGNFIDSI